MVVEIQVLLSMMEAIGTFAGEAKRSLGIDVDSFKLLYFCFNFIASVFLDLAWDMCFII